MRFKDHPRLLLLVQLLLCITAAAFIYIGVRRGEVSIVLKKAVNICLECIGLG